MKLAFLSDVHGNYKALQRCLEHAKARGVDHYIFLGDYLGEYPYPRKTMNILNSMREENSCIFLRGNKEDYWINLRKGENCDWKNGNHSIRAMLYSYENLKAEDIDFFETLPISRSISFGGMAPIMICHGAPDANRMKLLPDDEKTEEIAAGCKEKYIVCGHTHVQGVIMSGEKNVIGAGDKVLLSTDNETELGNCDKTVLNAGAVGVPLNAAGCTQYMLLESVGSEWKYEFVSLPYDIEEVIAELHESGLWEMTPYWCRITAHLLRTGKIPHGTVLSEVMRLNEYRDAWYNIDEAYWEKALQSFGIE